MLMQNQQHNQKQAKIYINDNLNTIDQREIHEHTMEY